MIWAGIVLLATVVGAIVVFNYHKYDRNKQYIPIIIIAVCCSALLLAMFGLWHDPEPILK